MWGVPCSSLCPPSHSRVLPFVLVGDALFNDDAWTCPSLILCLNQRVGTALVMGETEKYLHAAFYHFHRHRSVCQYYHLLVFIVIVKPLCSLFQAFFSIKKKHFWNIDKVSFHPIIVSWQVHYSTVDWWDCNLSSCWYVLLWLHHCALCLRHLFLP